MEPKSPSTRRVAPPDDDFDADLLKKPVRCTLLLLAEGVEEHQRRVGAAAFRADATQLAPSKFTRARDCLCDGVGFVVGHHAEGGSDRAAVDPALVEEPLCEAPFFGDDEEKNPRMVHPRDLLEKEQARLSPSQRDLDMEQILEPLERGLGARLHQPNCGLHWSARFELGQKCPE